ncbi:helicase [Blattabacterium sp. (Cryptocercus kyebangensis)]|uniref:UvrD-helicase domain-containing protein n=1 Tax=Blattabacterium sp. (Cryptocercus kyebangensis) TaxID=298656 RepID=UPI000D7CBF8E|nr:UvrD-helicase domain-containing protein [Blattabacterium sp. (Cryptocercus kyebangensis)]AWU43859.1 helicase [Blattabacterium sp. (Cryptocercus kyebangensis)]
MLIPATLKIYNASAGSGKTFFLVKNYLFILFKSSHCDEFKRILALTFTNKATEEIKKRILQCIKEFSNQKISKEYHSLFNSLTEDLKLTKRQLSERAKKILSEILYDFSSFSISTIDKFTYRTIRSFFSNKNLDLEMDTHKFLWEVVDNLYNRLKNSEKESHILIQFSLERLKEGKNWDIRKELFKIASLIVEENSFFYMKKIKIQSSKDWIILKTKLLKRTKKFEKKCKKQGEKFFEFLKKTSIQKHSFHYSDFPKLFQKLRVKEIILNPFHQRIEKSIQKEVLYSSKNTKTDMDQKILIKRNKKKILSLYKETKFIYKKYISSYILDKLFLKNFHFLSIIQEIEKEFISLKKEKKIILNAELNKILHERIIQGPLPLIYEKMGVQYKHYFIDEFQDTSFLQWYNIRILVENALSENGSAMIVGDPKQSIYRWRGGDANLFLHLISSSSKSYHKKIITIETNFRSYEEIVKFNNSLYQSVSKIFNSTIYKKIYKESKQKEFKTPGGYVELNFVMEQKNYRQSIYCKIKEKIKKLLKQEYKLSDIAILVRSNEDGTFLSEKLVEDGFIVNTSVSLLIKNHLEIEIIIHFFYLLLKPHCYQKRATLILLLLQNKFIHTKKKDHDFIVETIFLPFDLFFKKIFLKKNSFFLKNLYNKSIYNIVEQVISGFGLLNQYNTESIYSFLDFVHRSMKIVGNSIVDFLEYWEAKKEKESIIISDNIDAIRIMTIHKSKGLQFPVVILPFTDWNAFSKKKEGIWIDVCPRLYHGLDTIYLEIEPYFKHINDHLFINFYEEFLSKIRIDNLNLLYVATTRPMEQLIIFSRYGKAQSISFYLKNFLHEKKLWNDKIFQYSFGIEKKNS